MSIKNIDDFPEQQPKDHGIDEVSEPVEAYQIHVAELVEAPFSVFPVDAYALRQVIDERSNHQDPVDK